MNGRAFSLTVIAAAVLLFAVGTSAAMAQDYPLSLSSVALTLPRTEDREMDRILNNPKTIFYKLPQVYQHWIPASRIAIKNETLGTTAYSFTKAVWGIHPTTYLPEFNANPDFPWEVTVGLNVSHRAKSNLYGTVNFLSLPEDEDRRVKPVLILTEERPVKWVFPAGTVFGEIIYVTFEQKRYVQEIRTRKKSDDNAKWFPGVFRPIGSKEEFERLTRQIYIPNRKFMTFRNPEEDQVFELKGTVEQLPEVSSSVTRALLARAFKDVTKENWSPAPTQDFAILPKDYSFGLINPVDSLTCAGCHRQTQISVRNLIPNERNIIDNPSKVGNIRGCDGIFTWYPFDKRSVGQDAQLVYIRDYDVRNGIVRLVGRGQAVQDYHFTLYVQQALKDYELPHANFLHEIAGEKPPVREQPNDGKRVLAAVVEAYTWEYREELDRTKYFRGVLVQNGIVIGTWDWQKKTYRTVKDGRLGDAATPPIPVPSRIMSNQ